MTLLPALRDAESDLSNWRKSPLRPLLETATSLIDAEKLEEVAKGVSEATQAVTEIDELTSLAGNIAAKLIDMVGDPQAVETTLGFSPTDPERLIRSLRLFIDGGERSINEASLGSANLIYLAIKSLELDRKQANAKQG
jgi:putative ATP-dependent endonuclease of OLD family